ncbi:MAG: histidine kinase dimerization/phosphoacceptor domain-containing protein, partial [Actinomycetota bacterium]
MEPTMTGRATTSFDPATRRRIAGAAMIAVSLAFGVAALVLDIEEDGVDPTAADVSLVVVACAALALRWRAPVAVLAMVVAMRLSLLVISGSEIALIPAVGFAFYVVGQVLDRRRTLGLAALVAIASTVLVVAGEDGQSAVEELLSETAVAVLPAALGDATRSRRERIESLVEAEAEARVQAERLRIARDLHDVVAHSLSTIAVQSGVAAHNLGDADPDDPVRLALERINATGKRSLEELRAMVGVLRSTD